MKITFKITSPEGLHARPATTLVSTASKFSSQVFAEAKGRKVTMKSLLGVLSLGVVANDKLTFIAEGDDAAEVIEAYKELFKKEELGVVDNA